MTTLAEIGSHIDIFFDDKYIMTAEAKEILKKDTACQVVKAFAEYLNTAAGNPQENYLAAIKYTKEKVRTYSCPSARCLREKSMVRSWIKCLLFWVMTQL